MSHAHALARLAPFARGLSWQSVAVRLARMGAGEPRALAHYLRTPDGPDAPEPLALAILAIEAAGGWPDSPPAPRPPSGFRHLYPGGVSKPDP
jgi:hypothetical protein